MDSMGSGVATRRAKSKSVFHAGGAQAQTLAKEHQELEAKKSADNKAALEKNQQDHLKGLHDEIKQLTVQNEALLKAKNELEKDQAARENEFHTLKTKASQTEQEHKRLRQVFIQLAEAAQRDKVEMDTITKFAKSVGVRPNEITGASGASVIRDTSASRLPNRNMSFKSQARVNLDYDSDEEREANAEHEAHLQRMEQQMRQIELQGDEIKRLGQELEVANKHIEEMKDTVRVSDEAMAAQQNLFMLRMEEFEVKTTELSTNLAARDKEIRNLKGKIENYEEDAMALRARQEQLEKAKNEATQTFQKQKDQLEEKITVLNASITKMQNERAAAEVHFKSLVDKLELDLNERTKQLEAERAANEEASVKASAQIENLDNLCDHTIDQLDASKAHAKELDAQLREATKELNALATREKDREEQLKQLIATREELTNALSKERATHEQFLKAVDVKEAEWRKGIEDYRQELKKTLSELAEMKIFKGKCAELQQEIKNMRMTADDQQLKLVKEHEVQQQAMHEALQREIVQLQEAIEGWKGKEAKASNELKREKERAAQLEISLRKLEPLVAEKQRWLDENKELKRLFEEQKGGIEDLGRLSERQLREQLEESRVRLDERLRELREKHGQDMQRAEELWRQQKEQLEQQARFQLEDRQEAIERTEKKLEEEKQLRLGLSRELAAKEQEYQNNLESAIKESEARGDRMRREADESQRKRVEAEIELRELNAKFDTAVQQAGELRLRVEEEILLRREADEREHAALDEVNEMKLRQRHHEEELRQQLDDAEARHAKDINKLENDLARERKEAREALQQEREQRTAAEQNYRDETQEIDKRARDRIAEAERARRDELNAISKQKQELESQLLAARANLDKEKSANDAARRRDEMRHETDIADLQTRQADLRRMLSEEERKAAKADELQHDKEGLEKDKELLQKQMHEVELAYKQQMARQKAELEREIQVLRDGRDDYRRFGSEEASVLEMAKQLANERSARERAEEIIDNSERTHRDEIKLYKDKLSQLQRDNEDRERLLSKELAAIRNEMKRDRESRSDEENFAKRRFQTDLMNKEQELIRESNRREVAERAQRELTDRVHELESILRNTHDDRIVAVHHAIAETEAKWRDKLRKVQDVQKEDRPNHIELLLEKEMNNLIQWREETSTRQQQEEERHRAKLKHYESLQLQQLEQMQRQAVQPHHEEIIAYREADIARQRAELERFRRERAEKQRIQEAKEAIYQEQLESKLQEQRDVEAKGLTATDQTRSKNAELMNAIEKLRRAITMEQIQTKNMAKYHEKLEREKLEKLMEMSKGLPEDPRLREFDAERRAALEKINAELDAERATGVFQDAQNLNRSRALQDRILAATSPGRLMELDYLAREKEQLEQDVDDRDRKLLQYEGRNHMMNQQLYEAQQARAQLQAHQASTVLHHLHERQELHAELAFARAHSSLPTHLIAPLPSPPIAAPTIVTTTHHHITQPMPPHLPGMFSAGLAPMVGSPLMSPHTTQLGRSMSSTLLSSDSRHSPPHARLPPSPAQPPSAPDMPGFLGLATPVPPTRRAGDTPMRGPLSRIEVRGPGDPTSHFTHTFPNENGDSVTVMGQGNVSGAMTAIAMAVYQESGAANHQTKPTTTQ